MQVYRIFTALTLVAMPLASQTVTNSNADDAFVRRLQAMMELPRLTASLRDIGVADTTIRSVLNAMQRANLPEPEQVTLLSTERDAARAYGPSRNFGAFVQGQLAAGLRGRELAAAIRREHARRRNDPTIKDREDERERVGSDRGPEHKEDVGRPKAPPRQRMDSTHN